MEASGAYIRFIREHRGFSRAELAAMVDTHESQLVRIEAGKQDTAGSTLIAIVRAIRGDIRDVADLMLSSASADEGLERAQQWLSQEDIARVRAQAREDAAHLTAEQLDAYLGQIEVIRRDRAGRGNGAAPQRKRSWFRRKRSA